MKNTSSTPSAVDVLLEMFGRVPDLLHNVLDGIDPELLVTQPQVGGGHPGNSIGWLVWHVGRMEDAQIAAIAGTPEVHRSGDWKRRLGTPYPASTHGYGMSPADVARFTVVAPDQLGAYYDDVHARTVEVLHSFEAKGLQTVVDDRWTPPVTALVRLVSIADDAVQHVGQAAYLRGLLTG